MIPEEIRKYFWEINSDKLNFSKRRIYILKRLLEYGNPKAIKWAWKTFPKKDWLEALASREVSRSVKNFWRSLLSQKR